MTVFLKKSLHVIEIYGSIESDKRLFKGSNMTLGESDASVVGYLGKATAQGREIHGRSGAQLQDVAHFTGSGANDTQQGGSVACTEIVCMGHPGNAEKVWVRTGAVATVDNAWPLGAGEVFSFGVNSLSELQMLIVTSGEKLIVAYA